MKRDFSQMELMQAFKLYNEEGLKAVERVFPQHVQFVKARQSKTYKEIKEELLQLHIHA